MICVDKRGFRVELTPGQVVTLYPAGGGFSGSMPLEKFLEKFSPEAAPPAYFKAKLSIDGEYEVIGYVNAERWNGWAMPFFEHEEVLKIAQANPGDLAYEADKDRWVCQFDGDGDDEDHEVWERSTLEVDGKTLTGFWIGAGSWCWDAEPV